MTAPNTNTMLHDAVRTLADARARYDRVTAYIKEREAAFRATIKIELDESDVAAQDMVDAERNVKALAEAAYRATGDVMPAPGITVKLFTKLRYSAAEAFAWARDTHMALIPEQLDVKAFEKIAKATTLPFVTTETEPKVTIASDLDKALAVVAQDVAA